MEVQWPPSSTYLIVDYSHWKKKVYNWNFSCYKLWLLSLGTEQLSQPLLVSLTFQHLCDENLNGTMDKRRALNIVCLDFRKSFDTLCHTPLVTKLVRYGLGEWKMRGGGKFARVISTKSSWKQCP